MPTKSTFTVQIQEHWDRYLKQETGKIFQESGERVSKRTMLTRACYYYADLTKKAEAEGKSLPRMGREPAGETWTPIEIPPRWHRWLKQRAEETGIPVRALVDEALHYWANSFPSTAPTIGTTA